MPVEIDFSSHKLCSVIFTWWNRWRRSTKMLLNIQVWMWGTFQGYSCMCDAQLECDSAFELREESHPLFAHQYVPVLIYRKCVCVCVHTIIISCFIGVLQWIRLQSRSIRCGEGSETEAGGSWWLHPNNDCTGTVFTSAEIELQSIFPHLTAPCLTQRHT